MIYLPNKLIPNTHLLTTNTYEKTDTSMFKYQTYHLKTLLFPKETNKLNFTNMKKNIIPS